MIVPITRMVKKTRGRDNYKINHFIGHFRKFEKYRVGKILPKLPPSSLCLLTF